MSTTIDSSIHPVRRRAVIVAGAALVVVSAMLLSACEDKDGTPVAVSSTPTSVVAVRPGADSGQSTVRTVGKTGWYDGFDITVDKATVVPDEYGGAKLRIDITYKNTTLDDHTLSITPSLLVGREVDGGAIFDSPAVPGNGSATGNATTSVPSAKDAEHLIDTMTIVYGKAADNQTKIPLAAAGRVDSVQPRTLPISGTLVQDQTTIRVTGGRISPSYTANENGKSDLALRIALVGGAGIPAGGANIYYDYFTVRTPDGQTVAADIRGPINELLNANETIDNPKNYVVFVVPSPGAGPYTVTYNAQREEGASTAPTLSFTVG
ncbi:hypothetical protein [Nocardia arthritidis]|uniref:hypothetical protein n=1 Tax=Nocardia arthritidis TaxID=228602 RepID=UPI000A75D6C5|nr:hypothetical protein [Nocardia arthritidis]